LLFSFSNEKTETYLDHDLGFFDLFEHHVWMSQQNGEEFYKEVDYNYERFDLKGYRNLALKAEPAYRARPKYWAGLLRTRVTVLAAQAARVHKPLITTECWALVEYKDWPKLEWSWIKDLCKIGAETASGTGRWLGIATSNFCGPQFDGMWRDVRWHREMTAMIRSGPIAADLRSGRLWDRL
jgi:Sugar-binding cellulase-like